MGAATGGREATSVLRRLALSLSELEGADRRRAEAILSRPTDPKDGFGTYFGEEAPGSPVCDADICVHWAAGGKHAPARSDADADGAPDFAEQVLAAGAYTYSIENGLLGWRRAKSDGSKGARAGRGGEGQVDIYLAELGTGLFGYAAPEGNSGRSRSGHLVVDNDYTGFGGDALDLMRVTIAHEYNHILQFAYDVKQDGWMFESTATWVEDLVYPEINDYLNFVGAFAKAPFKPMAETDRKATRLYGSAIWNHWLATNLGAATIRNAWERSASVRPRDFAVAAYDEAIAAAGGGGFERQFAAFAAATAELNSSAAFPDPGAYPEMARSGTLRGSRKLRLDHTAYRLYKVRVRGGGDRALRVRAQRGTRSALALVGGTAGEPEVALTFLPRGGRGIVRLEDTERFDRVTAVVINADGRVKGRSRDYSRDGRRFRVSLKAP